ncbi:MAG: alpha/beta-Hydrolase superfamily protein [Bacteroidota bacterium]|nr:alpha/beta-Hydrolase superfamily protein [Bacteroidota bacterium]
MKFPGLSFLFLYCSLSAMSQTKTPAIFRWQDKSAKKHLFKFVKHDTLMATKDATLHITYNNDSTKPYLLMLHGMGANARTNWSSQVKELSKKFNLILPDLIYFGESTSASENYSVEFQVEQIHDAVLKLGISDKINVMGFSYGGLTAAMYNQLHPEKIRKLIIIDGPVKFYSGHMADSLAQMVGVANINNVIVPTSITEFNGMTKAVMSRSFPTTRRLKRKILTHFFAPSKATRDKQMNYLLEHQSTYQNYNYNMDRTPTLLIWGEKDGAVPVSVGKELHKAFPNTTQLLLFPKAKHDVHFRDYKKVNKAIINFIEH